MGRRELAIIEAPSYLGLGDRRGVECAPGFFRDSGLFKNIGVMEDCVEVRPDDGDYDYLRDADTGIVNTNGLIAYSSHLACYVKEALVGGKLPVVFGGDCSVLIGCLMGAKEVRDGFGLLYIDGHADFYEPWKSDTGEAADMTLGIVTGYTGNSLFSLDGNRPLINPHDAVVFGYRDEDEFIDLGSRDVNKSRIKAYSLNDLRSTSNGFLTCAKSAAKKAGGKYWLHLDVDVLDSDLMPAVDYRLEGGMNYDELGKTLDVFFNEGHVIGMDVTIYNPRLDSGQRAGRMLKRFLEDKLRRI